MTDREAAINEAFEEAGLIGTIQGKPIRITVDKKKASVTYKFYPFRISKICRRWPERKVRSRQYVKLKKASKLLVKKPYSEALSIFAEKFRNQALLFSSR